MALSGLSGCTLAAAAVFNAGLHNYAKLVQATAIAWAESRCSLVYNHICCYGAFQVYASLWGADPSALLTSWPYNAAWFMRISRRGTDWQPWDGDGQNYCEATGDCVSVAYSAASYVERIA